MSDYAKSCRMRSRGICTPVGGSATLNFPTDLGSLWHTVAMPKRLSRDDQPAGINQAAYQMVRPSTQTDPDPKVSRSEISRVMAAMGHRGGRIGGKRRMETMTAAQRREVASKAAKTRWAKHGKKHS